MLTELSEYLKELPKDELLIGERVYDKVNDRFVYIKCVEYGIWAGKNKSDNYGKYYEIGNLQIENK